jgi:Arc/MetJ-type ribon-helix-helix transcriptional regulator
MIIQLPKDVESSINAQVINGQFASADEAIAEAWREYVQRRHVQATAPTTVASQAATPPVHKPIWEVADELRKSIPADEWAKLPVDGASQHDHYIYGTPKRPGS